MVALAAAISTAPRQQSAAPRRSGIFSPRTAVRLPLRSVLPCIKDTADIAELQKAVVRWGFDTILLVRGHRESDVCHEHSYLRRWWW